MGGLPRAPSLVQEAPVHSGPGQTPASAARRALPVSGVRSPPPASFQARKHQKWAIKSSKTIFTVDFY